MVVVVCFARVQRLLLGEGAVGKGAMQVRAHARLRMYGLAEYGFVNVEGHRLS